MRWALAVHGGAGLWAPALHDEAQRRLKCAAERGRYALLQGQSALDAVCAVVAALEDDDLFNAGTGSVLNRDGEVEMDAAVMRGHDFGFGAVAAIRRVRTPVLVARLVLEKTPHALLCAQGATLFARQQGFDDYDPTTARAVIDWKRAAGVIAEDRPGTVGATALDVDGRLASATSTGGILRKLPGRIGDSPLPGAGTYATPFAAVSATGVGEQVLRALAGKRLCDLVETGWSAQAASEAVLEWMAAHVGADVGFIAVSHDGSVGISHRTPFMPHAVASWRQPELAIAMQAAKAPG
ncbi:MAG: peptidase T [Proteobacteria bacterium]|nr:MAG: peptidase T [Pseudomonadota bacterium]